MKQKKEVKRYVNSIMQFLIEKHGEIRESWLPIIEMIGNEYEIYLQATEELKDSGLVIQTSKGMTANPLVKIKTDALIQIAKLAGELHLTPRSENKMLERDKTDEDAQNLIAALMS